MSVGAPVRRVIPGAVLLVATCALLVRFAAAPGEAAGPWLGPVDVSAPGALVAQSQVAVDASGGAVAVWTRHSGDRVAVQAATRPAGASWQPQANLTPARELLSNPQVAVGARGDAVAVWERFRRGGRYVVQAAARPAGGGWERPVDVSGVGRRSSFPQVAVDLRGNAIAVWSRRAGGVASVQAARRPAGGSWRRPVDLARDTEQGAGFSDPRVAMDARGNAVAVWTRIAGRPSATFARESRVQAAVAPARRRWRAPVTLSAAGKRASSARVALNARGDAVAAWSLSPATEGFDGVVQSAARTANGRWQVAQSVSDNSELAAEPRVAIDADGAVTVIWNRSDLTGASSVRGAAKTASGPWQAPVDVSVAGERASGGELAVSARGDAFAVWHRYLTFDENAEQTTTVVRAARRAPGTGWQPPADISGIAFQGGTAQIAADPRGGAVAIWERSVGDSVRVQAATHPGG